MPLVIIIILGLIAFALFLIAQFEEGPGAGGDPITRALERAILRAREVIGGFPGSPTPEDCERLRLAIAELDQAIGNVPPGLPKYDAQKDAAQAVRDAIARLLRDNCG